MLGPLSHFEITGRRREHGTNVYSLRLNINLKSRTLEELRENRRCTRLNPQPGRAPEEGFSPTPARPAWFRQPFLRSQTHKKSQCHGISSSWP